MALSILTSEEHINMLKKILSTGEPGVAKAALDAAIFKGVEHSGSQPKKPETPTANQNIIDSDGTLILSQGELTGRLKLMQRYLSKYALLIPKEISNGRYR